MALYNNILDEFIDHLIHRKYKYTTDLQYAYWIDKVLEWEGMTLNMINNNIGKLCVEYDTYGEKGHLGEFGHRSVINALKDIKNF